MLRIRFQHTNLGGWGVGRCGGADSQSTVPPQSLSGTALQWQALYYNCPGCQGFKLKLPSLHFMFRPCLPGFILLFPFPSIFLLFLWTPPCIFSPCTGCKSRAKACWACDHLLFLNAMFGLAWYFNFKTFASIKKSKGACLNKCFSNFIMQISHLANIVKRRFWYSKSGGWGWESAFLTSNQVTVTLLGSAPNNE